MTAGAKFVVTWKGPANAGDYITVVPPGTPDGEYRNYTDISRAHRSPAKLTLPKQAGVFEIRYMSGQGNLVLARAGIEIR